MEITYVYGLQYYINAKRINDGYKYRIGVVDFWTPKKYQNALIVGEHWFEKKNENLSGKESIATPA